MKDKFLPLPRLPGENGLPLLPILFVLHEVNMFEICLSFGELVTGRDGEPEMKRRLADGSFSSVILLTNGAIFFFPWTDGDGKLEKKKGYFFLILELEI